MKNMWIFFQHWEKFFYWNVEQMTKMPLWYQTLNIKGHKVVLKLGDLRKCFVIADIGICFVLSNDKVSNCGRLCQALTLFPYGWLKKTRSDILKGQALFTRLNYSFSFLNYRPQIVDWVIYYTGNKIKKSI